MAGPGDPPGAVAPGQVEQLAAHLLGGQAEEVAHRGGLDVLQGAQQPQDGVLQQVAALLPAAHRGEAPQHLAGEALQPGVGGAQHLLAGGAVAGADALHPAAELRGVKRGVGHGRTSRRANDGDKRQVRWWLN